MMKTQKFMLLMLIPALTMIFAGCDIVETSPDDASDDSGAETTDAPGVQVQMQSGDSGSKAGKMSTLQQSDDMDIREVKLFVEEMELESIHSDSLDFELENFIVNLPLDGSPLVVAEKEIPAGLYDEFELSIEKPDDDDVTVDDPDFRDETGSYSIVVNGLYREEEFTFRSSEDFEIDIELRPALEITESGNSVMVVTVEVDNWFKGADGETLDPNDFANTEQINENIEAEFKAEGIEDERDFEGVLASIDPEARTFSLQNGLNLQIIRGAEMDGDYESLEEVLSALQDGVYIEAEGEYYIHSNGTNMAFEVEFEVEDDDEDGEREFEGYLGSVDSEAGTFTLENGVTFVVNEDTEIEGDYTSLEEVQSALENDVRVEAEGEYRNEDNSNIALEVEFESEEDDEGAEGEEFEGVVESVDTDADSFTLESGTEYVVTTETEFDGDYDSIDEVQSALDEGITVEAEGDYRVQADGTNTVIEVEFEAEDDDND